MSSTASTQDDRSAAIRSWITAYLSKLIDLNERDVNVDKTFSRFGLDSASTAAMAGELSTWLGAEIDPSVAYDYPTIRKLSDYLAQNVPATQPAPQPASAQLAAS